MFKPKTKQSAIPPLPAAKSILSKLPQREVMADEPAYGLLLPMKLLEVPTSKNKSKITAPLLVKPHKYPKAVQEVLSSNQEILDSTYRGIGTFKDINWFYHDRKIIFWRTGMQATQYEQVEKSIISVSMGFIGNKISQRRLGGIVVAVAIANQFTVYSFNEHSMKFRQARQTFEVDYTLQIRRLQWTSDGILMVAGDQYCLEYHNWIGEHSVIKAKIPLYRRLLPIAILFASDSSARQVHNILLTRNKVYLHVKQVREKSWLRAKVDIALDEDNSKYCQQSHIEVFSLDRVDKMMKFQRIISERELLNRLKVDKPEAKAANIKAIYLDSNSNGQQQLGIVTANGYFLTLRNSQQTYFSKQPETVPPAAHFGEITLVTAYKPEVVTHQIGKAVQVISSLGYSSLTLTKEALFWVGPTRLDGIRAEQIFGELCLRQDKKCQNPLFREDQWALYTFSEYFTVKQLPLRHLLGAFLDHNIPNSLVIVDESIRTMEHRLVSAISPSKYIEALIQLIAVGQGSISIDDTIMEIIKRELRKENAKDFRDTEHQIRSNAQIREIAINNRLAIEAWNSIIKIYLGSNSQPLQSPYWIAIQSIFYGLVSQLFNFEPSDFLEKRNLVTDISTALTSLSKFIDRRMILEEQIRHALLHNKKQLYKQETQIWLSSSMAEQLAINRVSSQLLSLEEQIKYGIRTTIAVISIFFSLADSGSKLRFGQLLSDDKEQQDLRLLLLKRESINDLLQIHKNLPQLQLNIDVDCMNTLNRFEKEPSDEQISNLATIINSYHFPICFKKIITPKLQIRLMLKYQIHLASQNTTMVKENSLLQRTMLIHSLFPEDDNTKLKIRRQRIQNELIIAKEKISNIIEATAKKFKDQQNKNNQLQLNQAAMEICGRPEFMNQLKLLMNDFKLGDKYLQLEKIGMAQGKKELFPQIPINKTST